MGNVERSKMNPLNLKPEHKAIREYYSELEKLTAKLNAKTEGAVAPLFANLLRHCAGQAGFTLIEQFSVKRPAQTIRVDGAVVDEFKLAHGLWEAKDSGDDLAGEIKKKIEKGYPKDNILFQSPTRAILYQDGSVALDADITKPEKLIEILKLFIEYEPPAYEQWGRAVEEFKLRVPEIGEGLLKLIEEQRKTNSEFVRAFEDFTRMVQESINPNIATQAVEEMLIQHILTERIFRTIFNNPDFATRNVIAREIEKVVQALTSRSFSRSDFLKSLDRFYGAIETTASTIDDYSQKQAFLNTVYEKFFQGFSVKAADIYGIVYTPQPIVNFMVNSVEHILKEEFGRSLSDENVHIIDPFVGTGNFIINIMRRIQKTRLPQKYAEELHCNEVMLLPYYIASMNIEHAYYDLTGSYKPYEGICLVDTFEVTEQMSIFGHENTQRIAKQRNAPIFVVIANPPYNAKQVNENDNNKKRLYPYIDKRVSETYVRDSKAQNRNSLSDVYVKAIKWASDRIKDEGIVAYITNNGFLDGYAFDGMRKHLEKDFSKIIHINLKGNARTSGERRQREAGNVFDDAIRVGVGISFFIRRNDRNTNTEITYYEVDDFLSSTEKHDYLDLGEWHGNLPGKRILKPDSRHTWLTEDLKKEFDSFITLYQKNQQSVFNVVSNGVKTNRDIWAINFSKLTLERNIRRFIDTYNSQVSKWAYLKNKVHIDDFVDNNDLLISWSRDLKLDLARGKVAEFVDEKIREEHYRPFVKEMIFFDKIINEEVYQFPHILPTKRHENTIICFTSPGSKLTGVFATKLLMDLNFFAGGAPIQCFAYYTYNEDGSNRNENITEWSLAEFRKQYKDPTITKWDIFHYVYGYLHHPGYRTKYAANLRRELPRIPYAPDFWAFAKAGKRLAEIHVHYEDQPEYPLTQVENPLKPLNWRVEKMKLSPDKSAVIYNDFLTLTGIPPAVYEYKLGNRSALEWIIDQYRVKTDPRSGITNDPNNPGDPDYILRLLKKIVTVSLETVEIVKGLPEKFEK